MTKDELQKAVDDVITDCIRNDYAFGNYAHRVTEAVWPVLEAAEKERDDFAQQLVQSEIGKREISEAHDALRVEVGKLKDLEVSRCVVEVQWAAGIPNGILDFISTDGYLPKLGDKLYALPGAKGE